SLPVRIENRSTSTVTVTIDQLWPEAVVYQGSPIQVKVSAGEVVTAVFEVTPGQRGHVTFAPMDVSIGFGHDIARRHFHVDDHFELSIYPDLKQLWTYDVLRRSRALSQIGVHRQRMMGMGIE